MSRGEGMRLFGMGCKTRRRGGSAARVCQSGPGGGAREQSGYAVAEPATKAS